MPTAWHSFLNLLLHFRNSKEYQRQIRPGWRFGIFGHFCRISQSENSCPLFGLSPLDAGSDPK